MVPLPAVKGAPSLRAQSARVEPRWERVAAESARVEPRWERVVSARARLPMREIRTGMDSVPGPEGRRLKAQGCYVAMPPEVAFPRVPLAVARERQGLEWALEPTLSAHHQPEAEPAQGILPAARRGENLVELRVGNQA